jgi:hypothetical protein
MSRKQLHTWRQRVPTHLNNTAPADVMTGTACEADERDQNAGEKKHAPSLEFEDHSTRPLETGEK